MKALCLALLALILALILAGGCGSDPVQDQSSSAIRVNDVTISMEEFNELIKLQAYSDPEMNLTRESRDAFVDYLIRKELMLQEAIRLKMDRHQDFIKTIETYWESTLVRRLLDHKTAELKKEILITEEEMAAYYGQHKDEFSQPYEAVKPQIQATLESSKLAAALETWTQGLRTSAQIRITPSLDKP